MPYTRTWDETKPVGSTTQAADIDLVFQQLKQDLRERLNELFVDFTTDPAVPKSTTASARVQRTTNQTISSSVHTAISFDTAVHNVGAMWSAGNPTRLTIPSTSAALGVYLVHGQITYDTPGLSLVTVAAAIRKNGSTFVANNTMFLTSAGQRSCPVVSVVLSGLASGDYLELVAWQQVGNNVDVIPTNLSTQYPNGTGTYFEAVRIL